MKPLNRSYLALATPRVPRVKPLGTSGDSHQFFRLWSRTDRPSVDDSGGSAKARTASAATATEARGRGLRSTGSTGERRELLGYPGITALRTGQVRRPFTHPLKDFESRTAVEAFVLVDRHSDHSNADPRFVIPHLRYRPAPGSASLQARESDPSGKDSVGP